ncbi:hypothetical protein [Gracilibacillus thailandensis]|uniref:Uncharacterized protein n=1 Tax=Gracilibacillus thailandensis TaxID=563735 RepID=A0A6N7QVN5_9BACI|nr:hypothetical protein [Gracilibacillus thailandensis]MRI66187.1 hypothetical protein [Gracilibacillus thailandensis]
MQKEKYCIVIYEFDFLHYHVLLVEISDLGNKIIDQVSNVSEDIASSFMHSIINHYKLNDYVQIMNRTFVNGQHKQTLYKTIGQFKKVYSLV